ncbi:MAG TPA: hypothetical protein VJT75_10385 [Thermoleophilaceae bacterium]|nr:hypothetical protein [Thermoleophilaceae bacterium]
MAPLARALIAFQVPYVAIGGVAVASYDPRRRPRDFDIVVMPSDHGVRRAHRAVRYLLWRWGLTEGTPPLTLSASAFGQRLELEVPLVPGTLHVVGGPRVRLAPDELFACRRWRVLDRCPVAICSFDHLVAMKRASGTPRDQADLELLGVP